MGFTLKLFPNGDTALYPKSGSFAKRLPHAPLPKAKTSSSHREERYRSIPSSIFPDPVMTTSAMQSQGTTVLCWSKVRDKLGKHRCSLEAWRQLGWSVLKCCSLTFSTSVQRHLKVRANCYSQSQS